METSLELRKAAELVAENLRLVNELGARFKTFYSNTVTPRAICYWLLQLSTPERVSIALKLLSNIHFVDDTKLTALLKNAIGGLDPKERDNCLISSIGKSYDSGAVVGYSFAKSLGYSETELTARWNSPDVVFKSIGSDQPLLLLDDNITSGTQIERYFSELSPMFKGKREHFLEPLGDAELALVKSAKIILAVALYLGEQHYDTVTQKLKRLGFDVRIVYGEWDPANWLSDGGRLWSSPTEAQRARTMVAEISDSLLKPKGWPDNQLKDRLLGYGNRGKLTVFSHNIIKGLPAMYWMYGEHAGEKWIPLFPERSVWTAHQNEILAPDPKLGLLADLVVGGGFGKNAPSCSAWIHHTGKRSQGATFRVPNAEAVDVLQKALIRQIKPVALMAYAKSSLGLEPTRIDVDQYNGAVALYETSVSEYREVLPERLKHSIRLVRLPLRVYNEGTAPATEVMVQLELPDGVEWSPDLPECPSPPTPPEKPLGLMGRAAKNSVEISLLSEISDSLRVSREGRADEYQYTTNDDGVRYVRVFFGKVVQSTFRDRDVQWLLVTPNVSDFTLSYKLVWEEAAFPVSGTLTVTLQEQKFAHPELRKAWFED